MAAFYYHKTLTSKSNELNNIKYKIYIRPILIHNWQTWSSYCHLKITAAFEKYRKNKKKMKTTQAIFLQVKSINSDRALKCTQWLNKDSLGINFVIKTEKVLKDIGLASQEKTEKKAQ